MYLEYNHIICVLLQLHPKTYWGMNIKILLHMNYKNILKYIFLKWNCYILLHKLDYPTEYKLLIFYLLVNFNMETTELPW